MKILDFGLAKLITSRPAARSTLADATLTMGLTDPGSVVGTVNDMSPEQALGEPNLTPQSDQFSFGLVLYELATGKRAFQRGSAPETMTAIIREDAEPLPDRVPAPLRWIVERLLAKEPSERYESTRDLYRELKQIRDRLSQATAPALAPAAAVSTPKQSAAWFSARAHSPASLPVRRLLFFSARPALPPPICRLISLRRSPMRRPKSVLLTGRRTARVSAYTTRVHGLMQVFTIPAGTSDAVQSPGQIRIALSRSGPPRRHCLLHFRRNLCPSPPPAVPRKKYMTTSPPPLFIPMARRWH